MIRQITLIYILRITNKVVEGDVRDRDHLENAGHTGEDVRTRDPIGDPRIGEDPGGDLGGDLGGFRRIC